MAARTAVMSGNLKYSDDDFVAKLLADDAKKSSQRYAAVGLSALLPQRSTKTAPKPNTRFLNHLVREADSHNAALKKKEELEARIRLREMRSGEKNRKDDEEVGKGHDRKRRRIDRDGHSEHRHRHDRSSDRRRGASPRRDTKSRDKERSRTSRNHHDNGDDRRRPQRYRSYSPTRPSRDSNRLSPPSSDSEPESRPSSSHRRKRNPSPPPAVSKPSRPSHQQSKRHKSPATLRHDSFSSSDPLESLIGPLPSSSKPNPQPRGRGTSSKSNIDTHFSTGYDPTQDTHGSPDPDGSDWDMALEALRDRTAWKRKQTDRLREAGFGEAEIAKWEKQGRGGVAGDEDERSVRWKGKGEAREWDLGKMDFT